MYFGLVMWVKILCVDRTDCSFVFLEFEFVPFEFYRKEMFSWTVVHFILFVVIWVGLGG